MNEEPEWMEATRGQPRIVKETWGIRPLELSEVMLVIMLSPIGLILLAVFAVGACVLGW